MSNLKKTKMNVTVRFYRPAVEAPITISETIEVDSQEYLSLLSQLEEIAGNISARGSVALYQKIANRTVAIGKCTAITFEIHKLKEISEDETMTIMVEQ